MRHRNWLHKPLEWPQDAIMEHFGTEALLRVAAGELDYKKTLDGLLELRRFYQMRQAGFAEYEKSEQGEAYRVWLKKSSRKRILKWTRSKKRPTT